MWYSTEIVGPYFFEVARQMITVTSTRYREMLGNFLVLELYRRKIDLKGDIVLARWNNSSYCHSTLDSNSRNLFSLYDYQRRRRFSYLSVRFICIEIVIKFKHTFKKPVTRIATFVILKSRNSSKLKLYLYNIYIICMLCIYYVYSCNLKYSKTLVKYSNDQWIILTSISR